MKRPLIASILILAAAVAQAEARSPIGGATMPREQVQSDPLGPRSDPTPTVAEAVARTQIEKVGYTGVRNLQRAADGTWRAVARDQRNAPVAVALDNQGQVTQTR
ncbi:MAG TPA: hypothetical protein VF915_04315 [Reyranella sp.]|jgi:hypothetical protein